MISVQPSSINNIEYYSRYNRIDKYEILDHSTRIVDSGLTYIIGLDGKINHTGLTFDFVSNNLYTYKGYFISGGTYLATHQQLKTEFKRLDEYVEPTKDKNKFIVKGKNKKL